MAAGNELNIRRTVRHEVFLPARVGVSPAHAKIVRLASTSPGEQLTEVDLVDFSARGIGLISSIFLPRKCLIQIQVLSLDEQCAEPMLDVTARVQRVVMTDRRPAYLIGTSFEDLTDEQQEQINTILDQLDEPGQARTA